MSDCCRYDFEQNKKNNLIFHGIIADHPETPEGWVLTVKIEISYQNILNPTLIHLDQRLSEKVARLVKANVNIKREMPISKASRVYSGRFGLVWFGLR